MRVLVLRPGALGDALLAFPVLAMLREKHADLHITFVSNPAVLELARVLGVADEVDDFGRARWSELFSRNGLREPELQALLMRTEMVIGWLRDPEGIVAANLRAAEVPHVVLAPGRPSEDTPQHVVSYLAATLGISIDLHRLSMPPVLPVLLAPLWRRNSDGACAIHPGSGGGYKCWPIERFAGVIVALWRRAIPVLLLAGPAEYERLQQLHTLLPPPPHPALFTQLIEVPLITVARALRECRGYLGNDSGVTHLASLLGLPTIVLFGPTNPIIWCPIGPQVSVLRADVLADLPIDQVLGTMEQLL